MEAPTHAETFKDGRKRTREDDILMHDDRENVGARTHNAGRGGHQIGTFATWL